MPRQSAHAYLGGQLSTALGGSPDVPVAASRDAASYGRQRGQKKEEVKVRNAIRRRTVTLLAVLAILVASTAVALSADSRPRPVSAISVVDTNGRAVGVAIGLDGSRALVVMRVGEVPISVQAFATELSPGGNTVGVDIHFQSTDCTGQAYIFDMGDSGDLLPRLAMAGQRVYQPSGPGGVVLVRSYLNSGDLTCATAAEAGYPDGFESQDQPATLLVDLAVEFTPPFRVRLTGAD